MEMRSKEIAGRLQGGEIKGDQVRSHLHVLVCDLLLPDGALDLGVGQLAPMQLAHLDGGHACLLLGERSYR